MSRLLIIAGLLIAAVGLFWPWISRPRLGRLPGDIVITRGNTSFHFPLISCLIASAVLSLLLWLFKL